MRNVWVLEFANRHKTFRIIFKARDDRPQLMWVVHPDCRKELQTKDTARSHWEKLVNEGWYQVELD